jgi:hypothetical protein
LLEIVIKEPVNKSGFIDKVVVINNFSFVEVTQMDISSFSNAYTVRRMEKTSVSSAYPLYKLSEAY